MDILDGKLCRFSSHDVTFGTSKFFIYLFDCLHQLHRDKSLWLKIAQLHIYYVYSRPKQLLHICILILNMLGHPFPIKTILKSKFQKCGGNLKGDKTTGRWDPMFNLTMLWAGLPVGSGTSCTLISPPFLQAERNNRKQTNQNQTALRFMNMFNPNNQYLQKNPLSTNQFLNTFCNV